MRVLFFISEIRPEVNGLLLGFDVGTALKLGKEKMGKKSHNEFGPRAKKESDTFILRFSVPHFFQGSVELDIFV